jgi:hypothetical protein
MKRLRMVLLYVGASAYLNQIDASSVVSVKGTMPTSREKHNQKKIVRGQRLRVRLSLRAIMHIHYIATTTFDANLVTLLLQFLF